LHVIQSVAKCIGKKAYFPEARFGANFRIADKPGE